MPRRTRRAAPVAYDLALMALAADQELPWATALFGTPAAVPWQAEGFVPPAEAWTGRPYLWLRKSAELRVPGSASQPRRLLLELAPHPDTAGQALEVRLKEQRLARLALTPQRRRYLIELPSHEGSEQRLSLSFEKGTEKLPAYRRSLAASVYAAAVGLADSAALETLARADAPALLEASREDGVPAVVQAGPGALHYVLRVPGSAELRFTPRLHPVSAGQALALRVTLATPGGAQHELWHGTAGGNEVALAIPASHAPGTLTRLSLHVLGKADEPAWVVWKAPRLLGEGATTVPPLAAATDADPRVDALRGSLSGVNVVLVVLDAAGARHMSAYGYARRTTPEIDRLAAEGVLFERGLHARGLHAPRDGVAVDLPLPGAAPQRGAAHCQPDARGSRCRTCYRRTGSSRRASWPTA